MDRNLMIKRWLKRVLAFIVIVVIAVLFGLLFAFSGNNPLLIHLANIIDMVLVAMTVLFVLALVYWVYLMVTGKGKSRNKTAKRTMSTAPDDIPELTELIDNLDSSQT